MKDDLKVGDKVIIRIDNGFEVIEYTGVITKLCEEHLLVDGIKYEYFNLK